MGGTALSRAYLNHRYSEDLDFFVNHRKDFRQQVDTVIKALKQKSINTDITVTGEDFARAFIREGEAILKTDFVNDIPYRTGVPVKTDLFVRTDSLYNILSNKLTALARYSAKDVADILFIALKFDFNWVDIIKEASEKNMWVNAVDISAILDEFPMEKLDELAWVKPLKNKESFRDKLGIVIRDLLTGNRNSLYGQIL